MVAALMASPGAPLQLMVVIAIIVVVLLILLIVGQAGRRHVGWGCSDDLQFETVPR